jgi:AcrR family transcriptional regulator
LGTAGARGLSHPKVDQHAGVPAGTTSFYYRTRKALLQAIAERITELDISDLSMMSELAPTDDHATSATYSGAEGLAKLVILSGTEPWLTRTKARYELMLDAGRDPELAETLSRFAARFYGLTRDVVSEWRPADTTLIDESTIVLLTYINGVMMGFVHGVPAVRDADHLGWIIRGILSGLGQPPVAAKLTADQRIH